MASESAGRILVIEDDPDALANLRDVLELDGYQVETAATGREAMDRAGPASSWPSSWTAASRTATPMRCCLGSSIWPRTRRSSSSPAMRTWTGRLPPSAIGRPIISPNRSIRTCCGPRWRGVSRLKEAERRAQQAERLAAIGQMATVLAHEGRNALQQIAVNLAILTHQLAPDRPDLLECIGRANKARHDLTRLFEDLRRLCRHARPGAGGPGPG